MIQFHNILPVVFESNTAKEESDPTNPLESKELLRQKKVRELYEKSSQGKLNADAVKKLAAQIENDDIRYEGFPDWVLKTWLDPKEQGAFPFKNNKWFDVKSLVNNTGDTDLLNRMYGGIVVNHSRKSDDGVHTFNLIQSPDLDVDKLRKLMIFQRAGYEAQKLIDRKNKKAINGTGGTTEEGTDNLTPAPAAPAPAAPPASSGSSAVGGTGSSNFNNQSLK